MFERSMEIYLALREEQSPVFFDRGIPDLVGYCTLIGVPVPADIVEAVNNYRYSRTVFIAPPWPEIYQHDEERKQGFQEAIETHEALRGAYIASGYELVELPKLSVAARLEFFLGYID
jgi:predicted ATPase